MFNGKIHRATVTDADLSYEGSVTIDADLMRAANIHVHESVHIWNVTRGTRLQTYAIAAPPGSGVVCVNGAAAHLNRVGDLVILATFVELEEHELDAHRPRIVRVDGRNRLLEAAPEVPGPSRYPRDRGLG
jgi:aspartate 1-decarboxylase